MNRDALKAVNARLNQRTKSTATKSCPACKQVVKSHHKECEHCGKELKRCCHKCKKLVDLDKMNEAINDVCKSCSFRSSLEGYLIVTVLGLIFFGGCAVFFNSLKDDRTKEQKARDYERMEQEDYNRKRDQENQRRLEELKREMKYRNRR